MEVSPHIEEHSVSQLAEVMSFDVTSYPSVKGTKYYKDVLCWEDYKVPSRSLDSSTKTLC